MAKTIPNSAKILLDFIGKIEAPLGYDTIYGNNQKKLPVQVTKMTIAEIQAVQLLWSKRYGSSATGRYQFMHATLKGLLKEGAAKGSEVFTSEVQDRLGYKLLQRRGFDKFVAGTMGLHYFGRRLAQEWASFPVLAATKGAHYPVGRGQSYYAGDSLNKALVSPVRVEKVLQIMLDTPKATKKPATATVCEWVRARLHKTKQRN